MRKRKFGITWGRMNYYSRVKELIQERERELAKQENEQSQFRLLGIINGLAAGAEMSHKAAIAAMMAAKREALELSNDMELFRYEIEFQNGYAKGLEQILLLNRRYFQDPVPFILFGLFDDSRLLSKYEAAMQFSELEKYVPGNLNTQQYFFTNQLAEVIGEVASVAQQEVDYAVALVVRDKDSQLLDWAKALSHIEPHRVSIVIDTDELNVRRMIDRILGFHSLG